MIPDDSAFRIYKVSTKMNVDAVIQNVMKDAVKGDFEKCKGWAVTEIIEQGGGKWAKVCPLSDPDCSSLRSSR